MVQDTFTLRPDDEFIELIKLLKLKNIAQSGGHAKMMVEEGLVKVNGELESRKRKKLRNGDVVEMEELTIKIEEEKKE
ncbi:MAG: ribosome-associated protein [Granulosicoccus sp.]|jgi:ribosome-associated protein